MEKVKCLLCGYSAMNRENHNSSVYANFWCPNCHGSQVIHKDGKIKWYDKNGNLASPLFLANTTEEQITKQ